MSAQSTQAAWNHVLSSYGPRVMALHGRVDGYVDLEVRMTQLRARTSVGIFINGERAHCVSGIDLTAAPRGQAKGSLLVLTERWDFAAGREVDFEVVLSGDDKSELIRLPMRTKLGEPEPTDERGVSRVALLAPAIEAAATN